MMKYIIFAIDIHTEEILFIFEYASGTEKELVIPELVKINNFCYMHNYNFDFFEIVEDPNYVLNKEGIYIQKYNRFTDILTRLDMLFTMDELKYWRLKNKEITDILTKKNKDEILFIINQGGDNYEIFKKLFETPVKSK